MLPADWFGFQEPVAANFQTAKAQSKRFRGIGNDFPFEDVGATSTSAKPPQWLNRLLDFPADCLSRWERNNLSGLSYRTVAHAGHEFPSFAGTSLWVTSEASTE